jgi:CNT family concentrative nucleoside transporter
LVDNLQSAFGLLLLMLLAWLFSERRQRKLWKVAIAGIGIQLIMAVLLLKLPFIQKLFSALNDVVVALQTASEAGSSFVFGYLGGGPLPFEETKVGASFVLAFRALPLVIVISALTALLTYWRILPVIVNALSTILQRSLGIGGAVGLGTAANVFVGMVEAPLFVRPYLKKLSRSELFMLMCAGMATIAGTVLILYATFLRGVIPDAVAHLLIASLISAPAAITIAKLMVPDDGTATEAVLDVASDARSSMDAITRGTQSGLMLFLNIVAMLIVFVALVHLVNALLSLLPNVGDAPITLERIIGYLMAPITWLMGIPWQEAAITGALMGTKTVLNEFLAYLRLADLPTEALSERSRLIISYALCGFANFGSLGIMIGGLTTMVPERRDEIVALGLKSIVAGTLATCCTGAVVGMLL